MKQYVQVSKLVDEQSLRHGSAKFARDSSFSSGPSERQSGEPRKAGGVRIVALIIAAAAFALAAVTWRRVDAQHDACAALVGGDVVWRRAHPHRYFSHNGLWGATTCDFAAVATLDLRGAGLADFPAGVARMRNLATIDARDNPRLANLPLAVAQLPRLATLMTKPAGGMMLPLIASVPLLASGFVAGRAWKWVDWAHVVLLAVLLGLWGYTRFY